MYLINVMHKKNFASNLVLGGVNYMKPEQAFSLLVRKVVGAGFSALL